MVCESFRKPQPLVQDGSSSILDGIDLKSATLYSLNPEPQNPLKAQLINLNRQNPK